MDIKYLVFFLVEVVGCTCIYAQGSCGGSKCCAGYIFDNSTSLCIPCRTGFIGKYCEKECPYPSFGDRCQLRCVCEQKHCDIIRGCITLLENGTGADKEDRPLSLNRTKAALYEDTSLPSTMSTAAYTKQNNVVVVIQNGQSLILIGVSIFNAFFFIVMFVVVMYCGITKYRKHNRNKKDNSAIAVQYHEINEDLAGGSRSYHTLHAIEETDVTDKAYDDVEMGQFFVAYENEPLNGARQSSAIPLPPNRASQTMPKEFYSTHENIPVDNGRC